MSYLDRSFSSVIIVSFSFSKQFSNNSSRKSWFTNYNRRKQHNKPTRIPSNITHNFLKVLKKSHIPGAIGFSFASHWLKN